MHCCGRAGGDELIDRKAGLRTDGGAEMQERTARDSEINWLWFAAGRAIQDCASDSSAQSPLAELADEPLQRIIDVTLATIKWVLIDRSSYLPGTQMAGERAGLKCLTERMGHEDPRAQKQVRQLAEVLIVTSDALIDELLDDLANGVGDRSAQGHKAQTSRYRTPA